MTTWIVGDIHGCAHEFADLIGRLGLTAEDQLVSCGDMFHRGPDPAGVMDLIVETGAQFILGNHERTVLKRIGLDPHEADASDRPALREHFPPIDAEDLDGDGAQRCLFPEERRRELLVFLQGHSGFFLQHTDLVGAPLTADGRGWCVVHAGVLPGRSLKEHSPFELTRTTRLDQRGKPWWYEVYGGKELVMYGHAHNKIPKAFRKGGRMRTLGLDTGCVYGGALTAYSPELDEFVRVDAGRAYVAA